VLHFSTAPPPAALFNRRLHKPIFLSIGYATCHWCHVMERESFENEEVAALLNETFVCIKVDREERPDIDEIYMTVCQMLTQSGGWPLTIVMTPDKKPFFAATYIPRENRFGRVGMVELIPRLSNAWKTRRDEIVQSATQIAAALSDTSSASGELNESVLESAFASARQSYDPQYGGFGGAPKFPTAHRLNFLMRHNPAEAKEMVEQTLMALRSGGIWDHIGFGIHRYSTDREWLVPHFEKMLYDQAMLAFACVEAFEIYGTSEAKQTAEQIFEYVLRDMTSPEGGFYSAEDADSEGVEGKFYVWSLEELRAVLSPDELDLAVRTFNVKSEGNFRDEATRQVTGENILHLSLQSGFAGGVVPPETSKSTGRASLSERAALEGSIRQKLFIAREKRIHPLKDTKVLADWNGLMIAALAKGARAFDEPRYEVAAQRAANFVWKQMQQKGRLMHRWREGHTAVPGQLDDYAFMTFGLLELYETTFDFQTLEKAVALNETVLKHFADEERGGFYLTADDAEKLLVRPKSMYDGALPSGNSVQMMNLLRLSRMTGRSEYEKLAEQTANAFAELINRSPDGFSQALQAVAFANGLSVEVVIVGDGTLPETLALIGAIRSVYQPNRTVLLKTPGLEKIAPFTSNMKRVDGKPSVYICRNFSCEQPLTDPSEVREKLR